MPRRNIPRKGQKTPKAPLNLYNCDNKKRYRTEAEALKAKEHQELLTMTLELRIYKCSVAGCGGWHLTRAKD